MIGIMDWGIGGLSVYQALRNLNQDIDVLYFSDSGSTPYGKMNRVEIRDRLRLIGGFFREHKISQLLVACNAASSALDSDIERFSEVDFHSIIPFGKIAVEESSAQKVGIIGGDLTISSQIYQTRLSNLNREFIFRSAQPLSAFVEAGDLDSNEVEIAITSVLKSLGPIESLLLACTHYPALAKTFERINSKIELLDPAGAMVRSFLENQKNIGRNGMSQFHFCTTGSPERSSIAARNAFQIELREPKKQDLLNLLESTPR